MNLLASLRYLVALHEHQHFGRAAQACHITQPALSNALRSLEREFGTPIVQRSRTYAGLTPEGELVLATARRMLNEHVVLQQELGSRSGQPVGVLRLGAVPTAVPVATRFITMLQARHGGVRPVLTSMSSTGIETGLRQLSLDLGLGFMEREGPRTAGFVELPQYAERYYLVRRTSRSLRTLPGNAGKPALDATITWAEAARLPLCLLTSDMHNRSIVDAAFARAGVRVQPVLETNSIPTLALSVQAEELASVMPGALVAVVQGDAALQIQPLTQPDLTTPVGFFTARGTPPTRVVQAALDLASDPAWRETLARHSGALVR